MSDFSSAPRSASPGHQASIPFSRASTVGNELEYMAEAIRSGHLHGDGMFTRRCENWIRTHFGAATVLLTSSCTAALEMAALLCNVGEGDEVVLPSFTFVSTANAFVLRGARLRFVDIRLDTLNIDEAAIESALTTRTRAIVPVHYAGVAAAMDQITDLATHRGVPVIEDAAHAFGARLGDRHLGTLGALGAYSFHGTKNVVAGEAGALVVNDEALATRAEIIREKGTDRSRYYRGEVDKYTWVDVGSSYLPSELTAAFLYGQLEQAAGVMRERRAIYQRYLDGLSPLAQQELLSLPSCPQDCHSNGHLFHILLPTERHRTDLIAFLLERGIQAVFHYVPLHLSAMGRRFGVEPDVRLPRTESASARLLRLPLFLGLAPADQERVIQAVTDFLTA